MTPEFNKWWDEDNLTQTNPYPEDTPVWWAWEGWQAGIRMQREKDALICEQDIVRYSNIMNKGPRFTDKRDWNECAEAIREQEQGK